MNGAKIRMIRELRGFSQENVAIKLGITQTSYSRIENNHSKLDTVMLEKLAAEFGVTVIDILSHEPTIVNFTPPPGPQSVGQAESSYLFQKELIEKIINAKDQEINTLKDFITSLLKDKEALTKLLQSKR
jgi:transcriptional regulator with XRE-family HTH domain